MALPPQTFQLDTNTFNTGLYGHIRHLWFDGLPSGAKRMNDVTAKRWWGQGATQEEREAFDEECRTHYASALESIGPHKLALPAWKSYADDLEHADTISRPFLDEVRSKNDKDARAGADTLLSLVILLDQMSRNIYRDAQGLRLIYTHYDRLAWTLLQSTSKLSPSPQAHPFFRGNAAYASWLGMPLMHAEDLPSQDECIQKMENVRKEAAEDGDDDTANAPEVANAIGFAGRHRDIIERFGRFPHRHECLGREGTEEEESWLKESGETFGVQQGQKDKEGKDEL